MHNSCLINCCNIIIYSCQWNYIHMVSLMSFQKVWNPMFIEACLRRWRPCSACMRCVRDIMVCVCVCARAVARCVRMVCVRCAYSVCVCCLCVVCMWLYVCVCARCVVCAVCAVCAMCAVCAVCAMCAWGKCVFKIIWNFPCTNNVEVDGRTNW